ncbi:MAG: hypothetical protein GY949_04100 [Gammaproteobacteria bacterium]|nr:hypothetical protein [Gammaproteobacteria bacterium]
MTDASSRDDLIGRIAEEFLERRRRGERATIAEYCAKYPDHAEEIRSVLRTFELVEDLQSASADLSEARLGPQPALEEVGGYRVIGEIGRGGMGVVYDALQESLGRRVALKPRLFTRSVRDSVDERRVRTSMAVVAVSA